MQGSDSSNAVQLNVKYAPVCSAGQKWVYGGGRLRPLNVSCRVESHPEAETFRWAFNASSEFTEIPPDRVRSGRGRSLVSFTPQQTTLLRLGSLLCWGRNEMDEQRDPCVFHVVPASVPESVHNCSAWRNATLTGEVVVACVAGWGGGLPQTFTLEVRQGPGPGAPRGSPEVGRVLASLRDQPVPHFTVTGLAPGTEYRLEVVASNAEGDAEPASIVHATPIDVAEKRLSSAAAGDGGSSGGILQVVALTPVVGVVVGVVGAMLVCAAVVVVAVRCRQARGRHDRAKIVCSRPTTNPLSKAPDDDDRGGGAELRKLQQDRGPDIILVKEDLKECEEKQKQAMRGQSPQDGSFYINSGSSINNTGLIWEADGLLQEVPEGVDNKGGIHNLSNASIPLTTSPHSAYPPGDALTSFSSTASSPVSFQSPQGHQVHPDLCLKGLVNCDTVRWPVTHSYCRSESREISV